MTEVFADTYYFVAILGSDGPEQRRAMEIGRARNGEIIVTTTVLTEVANFMRQPHERGAFRELVDTLKASDDVVVIHPSAELWNEALDLYSDRLDKEWSLTDCPSFVVMMQRRIVDALTADHHFEQAGFKALLKK